MPPTETPVGSENQKRKVWVGRTGPAILKRQFSEALEGCRGTAAHSGTADTQRTGQRLSLRLGIWGEVERSKEKGRRFRTGSGNDQITREDGARGLQGVTGKGPAFKVGLSTKQLD